ncbi:RodZ family helix-turn-helix domain-containing protein [Geothrix sp. 21YS21S-2]|uniref:helix-turn-helix domain-containing protein n=1 Tax=Geothrix sp. 21YS21S-2 TaxID=3068893 RepID=UPI0027BAEFDE|nr:helix-turn-helix domain-containing protein [Geothrix sp. 21YS21S-2]
MTGSGAMGEARCRELLEVDAGAGLDEIRRAHTFLKGLYSGSGLPSMDEFGPAAQARVLAEVEAAYAELCGILDAPHPPPRPLPAPAREPDRILDGPALKRTREAAGVTLDRMAAETNVRLAYLEALEEERFRDLPSAAVIVRGYLTAYLAALGLGAGATVADYALRFQRWQGKA